MMNIRFLLSFLVLWVPAVLSAAPQSLVVYSGRSDKFVKPVIKAFTAQTGIKVTIHSGSSTSLLNKLNLEAEKTTADLFISNDAGNLQKGASMKLFAPVADDVSALIPVNYRASDNTWIGLSARARVLVVNSQQKETDFVKSVFDLADPRLKDKLAITHSANGSYIAGVTVYMTKAGKEKTAQWLKGMKVNVGDQVFNKHSKIVKAVASSKKSIGLVNHYYIYRHLDKHPNANIRIVLPDQSKDAMGVAWNVAGAAIAKHSKNKAAAEKLMRFFVSKQGQEIFAKTNREYPTRAGVSADKMLPAAGSYKIADVPMSVLGEQRNATLDLIESIGMP